MSEYVKEYFSSALDFAGEEQGDTYRKYCVIQLVGPFGFGGYYILYEADDRIVWSRGTYCF